VPFSRWMSDIFISYSHEDTDFVRDLVKPLQAEGFSVWWDHTIPPGKSWEDVIVGGIRDAKACVIIWSPDSIASRWVKDEATLALRADKYLPIRVGVEEPPMGFRQIQAADLAGWNGNAHDPQWRLLITEIGSLVRGSGAVPPPPPPPQTLLEKGLLWVRAHRQQAGLISLGAVALLAVLLAVFWYALASGPQRQAAALAAKFTSSTLYPAKDGVDPAMVGSFTLDMVVVDFNTHYVDTINADGTYVITGVQEEDGSGSGDANGNFRNTGTNTGRVHTGTTQIIDATHFTANGTQYQLVKAFVPPGQSNPSLLGSWVATGNVAGQQWTWTWTSKIPGTYHFEGHWSDHGHTTFANRLWTATSTVTGQSGGGTYGVVDSTHVLINGAVWARQ
jgi:hypothetical protein